MGSKKKTGGGKQQQGQDKSKSHANGNPQKASNSPPSERKVAAPSTPTKGKSSKQKKDGASPPSSMPESRLPWRLILLISVVAGGVAIVCVNEPVKSVLEDVYVKHIEPQVVRHFGSNLQTKSPASDSQDKGSDQPSQKTQHSHTDSKPEQAPSGDRQKRESPPSTTPSPPPSTTTTAAPPPDTKPQKQPKKEDAKKTADTDKKKTEKPEKKTPSEEPKTEKDPQKKRDDKPKDVKKEKTPAEKPAEPKSEKSAQKQEATPTPKQDKTAKEKPAAKTEAKDTKKDAESKPDKPTPKTPEKKVTDKPDEKPKEKTVDPPTADPKAKRESPTEPVVEEIKVKTTPKSDKQTPDKPTQTPEKPVKDQPAKPAEKPVDKDEKPAQKPAEKPDTKPAEKTDGKSGEKSEQKVDTARSPEVTVSKSPANKTTARDSHPKANITNEADFLIIDKLDIADDLLENEHFDNALKNYDSILRDHPNSPRAQLGRAETLDKMAFKKKSNEVLEQSINAYNELMHNEDVLPELIKMAGRTLSERQQFRGWASKSAQTLQYLVDRFPDDLSLQREQGVSLLMAGQNEAARRVFAIMLENHPNNGFALAHMGFIVKNTDNDFKAAIPLLLAGIDSEEEGTQDGRFFFHLGDAYQRLGQEDEARKIYRRGADAGVFLSADQRSLYNINKLKSRPWWTREQTGYEEHLKMLEDNWEMIRDEGLQQIDTKSGLFKPEAESLRERGDWKQLTMYQQGHKNNKICKQTPKTCALIDKIPDAKLCRRGQVKFSLMSPGTHVWPHCGPTNCRIRTHLGLVIPDGPRIRVVNETRTWEEGKFIIFDDSFEHEVWHDGKSLRLVLIVDFWHPDLTEEEKQTLLPI